MARGSVREQVVAIRKALKAGHSARTPEPVERNRS